MTAPSRLKSTLELLVVLLLAFFIRLYVSIWSRSRRNLKAGDDEKREAEAKLKVKTNEEALKKPVELIK